MVATKNSMRGGKVSTTGPHSYGVMNTVFTYAEAFVKKMQNAILNTETSEKRPDNFVRIRDFKYLRHLIRKLRAGYYYLCRHEVMGAKTARNISRNYLNNNSNNVLDADDIRTDDENRRNRLIKLQEDLKSGLTIEEPKGRNNALTLYKHELIDFINNNKVADDQPDLDLVNGGDGGYLSVHNTIQYWYGYIERHGLAHTKYPKYIDYAGNQDDPLIQLLETRGLNLGGGAFGEQSALEIAALATSKVKKGKSTHDDGIKYKGTTNITVKLKDKDGKNVDKKVQVDGIFPKTEGMRIMSLFVMKSVLAPHASVSTRNNITRFTDVFKDIKEAKDVENEKKRERTRLQRVADNNIKREKRIHKETEDRKSRQQSAANKIAHDIDDRSTRSTRRRSGPSNTKNRKGDKGKSTTSRSRSRSASKSGSASD